MKDYTFNGKCYAVNLNDSAISDVSVIYYNKKALQDAEMEDPYQIWKKNPKAWTWEKFWSMCEQFVNANKNKSGYSGATFEYGDSYGPCNGRLYNQLQFEHRKICKRLKAQQHYLLLADHTADAGKGLAA